MYAKQLPCLLTYDINLYSSKLLKLMANPLNNITYRNWWITHTIQSINHNLGVTLYNYFLYTYILGKNNTLFHLN